MTNRRKRSPAFWAGLLLVLGLCYALFAGLTGWMLPCPIHAVTGLYCPGCGVSRMCMALLRLDFYGAWQANPVLLLCLPGLGGLLVWRWRTGWGKPTRGQNILIWAMVIVMLGFGILRNLPGLAYLQPVG